jgi:hypothetical protein
MEAAANAVEAATAVEATTNTAAVESSAAETTAMESAAETAAMTTAATAVATKGFSGQRHRNDGNRRPKDRADCPSGNFHVHLPRAMKLHFNVAHRVDCAAARYSPSPAAGLQHLRYSHPGARSDTEIGRRLNASSN